MQKKYLTARYLPAIPSIVIGTPGPIRTGDTQVRSLVLYPAELRVHAGQLTHFINSCLLSCTHFLKIG